MSFSLTTQSPTFAAIFVQPQSLQQRSTSRKWRFVVTMKGRSNNPRPLQKGRNLSIEAIQAVQSLKRAKNHSIGSEPALDSKFQRLLKFDMIAVLRELLRQDECLLALKVFEDVRGEYWYKPQVSLYADMIEVFGRNGLVDKVELVCSYLNRETELRPKIEEFNGLLKILIGLNLFELTKDCYHLMNRVGCDPDQSSFRILINGLESIGETVFSGSLRLQAQKYNGESLEFLKEEEEVINTKHTSKYIQL